ncbi:MAG TPA: glycosyltransferase [Solirubrobacterales bacterium]|jgi:cellulose synthase/poly-beta-1,6-N-acetylglucosamine synthase-like glycosyltransferase
MTQDPFRLVVRDPQDHQRETMVTVSPTVIRLVPDRIRRELRIIPFEYRAGMITVIAERVGDEAADNAILDATGFRPRWLLASAEEIARTLNALGSAEVGVESNQGATFDADYLLDHGLARLPRLGEELASRGLITEEQLGEAIAEQERAGGRIGEILVLGGALEEHALLRVVAEKQKLPTVDLSAFDPAKAPVDAIPEPLARSLRCVPIAIDDTYLFVAVPDLPDRAVAEEIEAHTHLKVRPFLAPASEIDALLRRIHGAEYSRFARFDLLERFPESSAHKILSAGQKAFLVLLALAAILAAALFFVPTAIVIFAVASIAYTANSGYKLISGYAALDHRYEFDATPEELARLDERDLPVYTVLVPLFREAAVINQLVNSIESLDYPRRKLDVRLLCEEDDAETIDAIEALSLPPHFETIIVPESDPQTKPKACNYGLVGAKGKYVVIYDAEDRPEPDQLKKAVAIFERADESVACVQAKLNFFNQDTNLLTRWFSLEYSTLFDLILPGLDARNDPIPLGGTSNHIRLDVLVNVGGWDPYNVTEDADLGIRLHKTGYRTIMMDSTTLEEANTRIDNWVRQRSRWIKGYIQTWLVYMRHPLRLLRDVGFKGFFSFQLMVGGAFIFLINPFFWALTTVFFLTQAGLIQDLFPGWVYFLAAAQLFLGNFVFMYLGMAAASRRGYYGLAPYALMLPLYWGLMSLAAWKGFLQLFTNPFYWEKTEHGLDMSSPGTIV